LKNQYENNELTTIKTDAAKIAYIYKRSFPSSESLKKKTITIAQSFDDDFLQGKQAFKRRQFITAERFFVKAYRQDSTNVELLLHMYNLSQLQNELSKTAFIAKKLKTYMPEEAFAYAYVEVESHFLLQRFDRADKVLNQNLKAIKMDENQIEKMEILRQNILFSREAVKHPVPFEPINLGPNINSKYAEYLPVMTQDARYIVYTRHLPSAYAFPSMQEDFYISEFKDSAWIKSSPLSTKINTNKNEGAPSISSNGKILYFGACNRSDSKNSCDIYYAYNRGTYWTTPKNVKGINTDDWESQPNISADGKTLFFVSDRPGGKGGKDIWAAERITDGEFSEPYNLGENINTINDEISPFLHFDLQTLYFSSDGWPGLGSKDIFISQKSAGGEWTKPQNLGYPINSTATDNSFFVDATGEIAYFSSKRKGGYGQEDLYKIELYDAIKPDKTVEYKLKFIDAKTQKPVSVNYALSDDTRMLNLENGTADEGEFSLSVKANEKYKISVFADQYMFYSSSLDAIKSDSLEAGQKVISLQPISLDSSFELENIEFDFDKASLKISSVNELKLFADYLQNHPKIKILIEGHTDNVGSVAYNQDLSHKRAVSVKQKLMSFGVTALRMKVKGYGASKVLYKEDELQHKNRRVVVRLLEK
jgi:outer membrane protein OmpA-like peptidoglycan-associated protein